MKTLTKPKTRCQECGGFHSPKCKPLSRREEVNIWKGILEKWKKEKEQ